MLYVIHPFVNADHPDVSHYKLVDPFTGQVLEKAHDMWQAKERLNKLKRQNVFARIMPDMGDLQICDLLRSK